MIAIRPPSRAAQESPARPASAESAAVIAILLLATAGLSAAPLPLELRFVGAYVLFVVLPGWLMVGAVLGPARRPGPLERSLLALGAGYGVAMLLGLVVYTLARPAAGWQIVAAAVGVNLGLLTAAVRRGARLGLSLARPTWPPLVVFALAGLLRLSDLGWSEFQGDEARIVLRAMAALQGLPDALAAHRKVPGEILLTAVFYGPLGSMTELVGRLPFVLAGLAGVLAFYELARRLFGPRVGLLAALLLAVDGYHVAFGRILQYDSLAFFLGCLGLLGCLHLRTARRPAAGLIVLCSLCFFSAILVALGAVFFLPAGFVLLAPLPRPLRRPSWRTLALWGWPAGPAALAAALVLGGAAGGAAGPSGVWSYLGPRLGGNRPYLNLDLFLASANHYLSTPYLALVLVGASVAILLALARLRREPRLRPACLAFGIVLLIVGLPLGQPRLALLAAALATLVLLVTSRHESPAWRMALVWGAAPLLVDLFLIRVPGTHWRESFPGFILLASALVVAGAERLPAGWPRLVPATGLALLILGVADYDWVSLVQRWPEYQMVFPQYRHPFDRTWTDGRTIGGVFGVAHRHGWKALALADAAGRFRGSYATNESPAIAAWYLRRPQGCPEPVGFVFRTPRAPQDRGLLGPVALPIDYVPAGRVVVGGHPTITIFVPAGAEQVGTLSLDDQEARFDRERTSPWLPVGSLYQPDLGAASARRDCAAGPRVAADGPG